MTGLDKRVQRLVPGGSKSAALQWTVKRRVASAGNPALCRSLGDRYAARCLPIAVLVVVGLVILGGLLGIPVCARENPSDPPGRSLVSASALLPVPQRSPANPSAVNALGTWTDVTDRIHPSPRTVTQGMVYDAADGYVVLFGGYAGYNVGSTSHTRCLNDTWTYAAGAWTNLSIPGPPQSCWTAMAYDSAAGVVLAYIYDNLTSYINQTWEFSHGKWSELELDAEPWGVSQSLAMSDDPGVNGVLLYETYESSSTWIFSGGAWARVPSPGGWGPGVSPPSWYLTGPTYDAADGYALMLTNASWEFTGTHWLRIGGVPTSLWPSSVAYDPEDGAVVTYGGGGNAQSTWSATWLYSSGGWTNSSATGPAFRWGAGMTFDAADGYIVLFGGCYGANITGCEHNDTWVFTPPPLAINLSLTVAPPVVCGAASPNCGAGTNLVRVSMNLSVVSGAEISAPGTDTGRGTVEYGPYYWIRAPTISFVPWGNSTLDAQLDPSASCTNVGAATAGCSLELTEATLSGGEPILVWQWNATGSADGFRAGVSWNVSFNLEILGPPFGRVPVDSCVTSRCLSTDDHAVDNAFSSAGIDPSPNGSELLDSMPLATVSVLGPLPPNPPPPATSPPPPAPPGVPVPLPVTTPPLANPTPISGPVAVAAQLVPATVSVAAVLSALLAAGLTRIVIARPAQAIRVANLNGNSVRRAPPVGRFE
jgi:hypothetical protein